MPDSFVPVGRPPCAMANCTIHAVTCMFRSMLANTLGIDKQRMIQLVAGSKQKLEFL